MPGAAQSLPHLDMALAQTSYVFLLLFACSSLASSHNESQHIQKRSYSDHIFAGYEDPYESRRSYYPSHQSYDLTHEDTMRASSIQQTNNHRLHTSRPQSHVGGARIDTHTGGAGNNYVKAAGGKYRILSGNFTTIPSKGMQRYIVQPPQTTSISDLSTVIRSLTTLDLRVMNPLSKAIQIGNYAPSGKPIALSCPVIKTENMIPWAPGVMRIDFRFSLNIPIGLPHQHPGLVSEQSDWGTSSDKETPLTPPPLQDTVVIILQMAATFRRNIVTVMGYVLNNPELHLSQELYMALSQIYNAARLRMIRVADILYVLQTISQQDPQQQCITILKEIINVSPPHIHSSIQLWLHALQHGKIKVNHVFRPKNGPLVIDFLAGIDFAYLNLLNQPVEFPSSIEAYIPHDVLVTMGKFFANVCAALVDGSIQLTQSLLAVFLLHIQPNRHSPEVEENLLYLADIFFKGDVELQFVFTQVDNSTLKNPYSMIQSILMKLYQTPEIDPSLRETIQICITYLQRTSYVVIDHDFREYFKFPSAMDMDFPLVTSLITPGEYPPDIIIIKNQILAAIIKNEIDWKSSLVGFIPHDYVHPVDMLVAIFERIRKRAVVPTYLVNPVAALFVHLKLKVLYINLESRSPRGFYDISFLFDSYKSPEIPEKIRGMAMQILEYLRQEKTINWNTILKEYPLHIWSRPRQTIVMILNYLITNNMVKSSITITLISDFIREVDPSGEPSMCPKVTCPGRESPIISPVTTPVTVPTEPPPVPGRASTIPPLLSNVDVISLVKSLGPQAVDDPRLEKLIKFLTSDKLAEILGPNFDVSSYPTAGELMKIILERSIQSNKLDSDTLQLLQYWLGKISLNGYGATKIEFVQKIIEEKKITINMNSVMQALDLTRLTNDGRVSAYGEFSRFLTQYFNPREHLQGFDFMKLKTSGEFLTAFFNHLAGSKKIHPSYKNAIRDLVSYVQTNGAGTNPVETLQ